MIDKLNMGYAPAFYVYDGLHVIAAVLALFMSLNVKLPAENIWKNVGTLLKNPKVVVFIFVVFFIGAAWGLLDRWDIRSLGACLLQILPPSNTVNFYISLYCNMALYRLSSYIVKEVAKYFSEYSVCESFLTFWAVADDQSPNIPLGIRWILGKSIRRSVETMISKS